MINRVKHLLLLFVLLTATEGNVGVSARHAVFH